MCARSLPSAVLCACAVVWLWGAPVRADDAARAVIERAIEAQGGEANVAKLRTMRVKVKGTGVFVPGQPAMPFTLEDIWRTPDAYKSALSLQTPQGTYTQVTAYRGRRGWMEANGQRQAIPAAALAEMKEQRYAEDCDRLLDLRQEGVQLTLLPSKEVGGRPAAGVKVSLKGHRDVGLYFDQETGLLAERNQIVDDGNGRLVPQVVQFEGYQEHDGVLHFGRIIGYRDGSKFCDGEVVEVEFFDQLDDAVFERP